jgi:hypothetical protein
VWVIGWQILLGLIKLAIQYLTRAETKDGYEKAREAQREAEERARAILVGSGEDITRNALLLNRIIYELLRTRKIKNANKNN